jgi:hypothetical protein
MRLLDTLSALQHDPNRPGDVLKVDADEDGNGGDDAADALHYLVATKSREVVARRLRGVTERGTGSAERGMSRFLIRQGLRVIGHPDFAESHI